jgi:hypothetical protein
VVTFEDEQLVEKKMAKCFKARQAAEHDRRREEG